MKNLKQLFTVLLLLCATVATAQGFEVDGINYRITDETAKSVEVASNKNYSGDVIIPSTVNYNDVTYSVTSIGNSAFYGRTGLTSIEIPNSVTSIGLYAFRYCTGLTSITIPNSVTSIGDEAFYGCTGLTSVTIGNSVTSIGSYAFRGTAWYENQPDGVVYVNNVCYSYKGEMPANTSITIKDGTLVIAESAFSGCSGLTSIEIPNSVTSIGGAAFVDCTGLTSIEIPNSVTSIGASAFSGCSSLESVIIPNSVTSIGASAFRGTAWLNNQPDGVVYVNNVCYSYKGKMPANTSITIKDGTLVIGVSAFRRCSGLTSIEIPNSVTSIGDRAFEDCTGLTNITIPNSVTSIGERAFSGCDGLTSVTIPNSVTSIGEGAFDGCSELKEVHISDLTAWCNIDFYTDESNPLYFAHNLYLNGELVTELVIPDGINKVKLYAFCGCSGFTSITIGNNVTSIGHQAFDGCTGLTSVTIGNSVTSIGQYAFYYCTGLTSITIPNSVTSIENMAFGDCTGLTSVTIGKCVTSIGYGAFYGCTGLINIVVDEGNSTYDSRDNCNAIIETATNKLIAGCRNTVIPNSVTNIGGGAFEGCTSLTSITIPNSVISIGSSAFRGCTGLTSITIPNSVTSIGEYAFYGCRGLTSITSLIPAERLFACDSDQFNGIDKANCTLYVPHGAKETYAATAGWNEFVNIVELESTDIDGVKEQMAENKNVYDLQGRKVDNPTNGIYIINGKKALIK